MKRYLVFYFNLYEEQGGMNDFVGDFDNLDDAVKHLKSYFIDIEIVYSPDDKWLKKDFGHIHDIAENKRVVQAC